MTGCGGVTRRHKGGDHSLSVLKSIRAARLDDQPIYVILDNLSANQCQPSLKVTTYGWLDVAGDDDVPTLGIQVLSSLIGGVTVTMNGCWWRPFHRAWRRCREGR